MRKFTLRAAGLLLTILIGIAPCVLASGVEVTGGATLSDIQSLNTSPPFPSDFVPQPTAAATAAPAVQSSEPNPVMQLETTGNPESTASPGPDWTPRLDSAASPSVEQAPVASSSPAADNTPDLAAEQTMDPVPELTSMPSEPQPSPAPTTTAGVEAEPEAEPTAEPLPDDPQTEIEDSSEALAAQGDGGGPAATKNPPKLNWKGVVSAKDGGMPIPQIYQYNYTKVLSQYSGIPRSVKTSGCNVTCVAMVAEYLTGEEYSPETLFIWALKKNLYYGNGLGHDAMTAVAEHCGVDGTWIGRDADAVIEALMEGKPVIAHMGPGLFTQNGHYIVLRGVTEDGKILVNDPISRRRSGLAFPMDTILRETRNRTPFMVCELIPKEDMEW